MMKYLLLLPLALLVFSCASDSAETDATTANDTTAQTDTTAADPALSGLSEEERKRYTDEYGIDVTKGMPTGLKVGESAPIFKATDHKGKEIFLPDLYAKQPVVVVFYRGAWCPACNQYLAALEDSLKFIKNAGGILIAVSPETREKVDSTVSKTNASYPIVADPNGYIMTAFKLDFYVTAGYQKKIQDNLGANIAAYNGTQEARLPVPATYIIGTDGKIKYVHFQPDYHERATVSEIVEELKKL